MATAQWQTPTPSESDDARGEGQILMTAIIADPHTRDHPSASVELARGCADDQLQGDAPIPGRDREVVVTTNILKLDDGSDYDEVVWRYEFNPTVAFDPLRERHERRQLYFAIRPGVLHACTERASPEHRGKIRVAGEFEGDQGYVYVFGAGDDDLFEHGLGIPAVVGDAGAAAGADRGRISNGARLVLANVPLEARLALTKTQTKDRLFESRRLRLLDRQWVCLPAGAGPTPGGGGGPALDVHALPWNKDTNCRELDGFEMNAVSLPQGSGTFIVPRPVVIEDRSVADILDLQDPAKLPRVARAMSQRKYLASHRSAVVYINEIDCTLDQTVTFPLDSAGGEQRSVWKYYEDRYGVRVDTQPAMGVSQRRRSSSQGASSVEYYPTSVLHSIGAHTDDVKKAITEKSQRITTGELFGGIGSWVDTLHTEAPNGAPPGTGLLWARCKPLDVFVRTQTSNRLDSADIDWMNAQMRAGSFLKPADAGRALQGAPKANWSIVADRAVATEGVVIADRDLKKLSARLDGRVSATATPIWIDGPCWGAEEVARELWTKVGAKSSEAFLVVFNDVEKASPSFMDDTQMSRFKALLTFHMSTKDMAKQARGKKTKRNYLQFVKASTLRSKGLAAVQEILEQLLSRKANPALDVLWDSVADQADGKRLGTMNVTKASERRATLVIGIQQERMAGAHRDRQLGAVFISTDLSAKPAHAVPFATLVSEPLIGPNKLRELVDRALIQFALGNGHRKRVLPKHVFVLRGHVSAGQVSKLLDKEARAVKHALAAATKKYNETAAERIEPPTLVFISCEPRSRLRIALREGGGPAPAALGIFDTIAGSYKEQDDGGLQNFYVNHFSGEPGKGGGRPCRYVVHVNDIEASAVGLARLMHAWSLNCFPEGAQPQPAPLKDAGRHLRKWKEMLEHLPVGTISKVEALEFHSTNDFPLYHS